jgi:hypothetical protein
MPAGHSRSSTQPPIQSNNLNHSQPQAEHKCCINVAGKMECQMMKDRHSDNPARIGHEPK